MYENEHMTINLTFMSQLELLSELLLEKVIAHLVFWEFNSAVIWQLTLCSGAYFKYMDVIFSFYCVLNVIQISVSVF